jgi:adenylate kinase
MAPITQETVDGLKDIISKLESRVAQMEDRLAHGSNDSKPKSISEQMRLILMGPPGAGAFP